MTELILGKRYRVVFNGTAETSNVDPNRKTLKIDGVGYLVHADSLDHAESVELLPDPLPTTPGSVVRWKQWSGELRTLSRETGRLPWRDVNSPHLCFSDEEVQGATVLFDVGP